MALINRPRDSWSQHPQMHIKTLPLKGVPRQSRKLVSSLTSQNLKLCLEIMYTASSGLKRRRTGCYQRTVQNPASMTLLGCMSAHSVVNLHFCESAINAERYIYRLWNNICCGRVDGHHAGTFNHK